MYIFLITSLFILQPFLAIYTNSMKREIIFSHSKASITIQPVFRSPYYSLRYKESIMVCTLYSYIKNDIYIKPLRKIKHIQGKIAHSDHIKTILGYIMNHGVCSIIIRSYNRYSYDYTLYNRYDFCFLFVKFRSVTFEDSLAKIVKHVKDRVIVLRKYADNKRLTETTPSITIATEAFNEIKHRDIETFNGNKIEYVILIKLMKQRIKDGIYRYELRYRNVNDEEGVLQVVIDEYKKKVIKSGRTFLEGYYLIG
eukprot:GAHX01003578.1.p1 GENE.GAHX01003578.1~~GAHX01003578.1.p1  ORF type:complete len:254 (+),score=24.94 GAHX01003578.1:111-872(+)